MINFEINFDGSCYPKNPGGHIGYGYVIKSNYRTPNRTIEKIEDGYFYKKPDETNTNNVAEYLACLESLTHLKEYIQYYNINHIKSIKVCGDSKLVVEQMKGNWRLKEGSYLPIAKKLKELISDYFSKFKIEFIWIPREDNVEADALSRRELMERGIIPKDPYYKENFVNQNKFINVQK